MATGSNFAWPSVTVKQSSTVQKGRSIVKCNWSDNFATLLEKAGSEFFNDIHFSFFFKSTYRPQIFGWVARETTNQFGMALVTNHTTIKSCV